MPAPSMGGGGVVAVRGWGVKESGQADHGFEAAGVRRGESQSCWEQIDDDHLLCFMAVSHQTCLRWLAFR